MTQNSQQTMVVLNGNLERETVPVPPDFQDDLLKRIEALEHRVESLEHRVTEIPKQAQESVVKYGDLTAAISKVLAERG